MCREDVQIFSTAHKDLITWWLLMKWSVKWRLWSSLLYFCVGLFIYVIDRYSDKSSYTCNLTTPLSFNTIATYDLTHVCNCDKKLLPNLHNFREPLKRKRCLLSCRYSSRKRCMTNSASTWMKIRAWEGVTPFLWTTIDGWEASSGGIVRDDDTRGKTLEKRLHPQHSAEQIFCKV